MRKDRALIIVCFALIAVAVLLTVVTLLAFASEVPVAESAPANSGLSDDAAPAAPIAAPALRGWMFFAWAVALIGLVMMLGRRRAAARRERHALAEAAAAGIIVGAAAWHETRDSHDAGSGSDGWGGWGGAGGFDGGGGGGDGGG